MSFTAEYYEEITALETPVAQWLAEALLDAFAPASVLDLGCGPGHFLLPYQARGVEVLGVDVSPHAGALLPPLSFMTADLTQSWAPPHPFDLVLCLEVAEHLPASAAAALVRTVVGCGNRIVWSAAVPGQIGEGHIHCQPPSYWERLFARYQYLPTGYGQALRAALAASPVSAQAWWYNHSLTIFARRGTC
jgi:SAM-dependent methyltransferase